MYAIEFESWTDTFVECWMTSPDEVKQTYLEPKFSMGSYFGVWQENDGLIERRFMRVFA